MDHTNADLDPLTFSDRIARTICLKLEQTTTFKTIFVKIGSAMYWSSCPYVNIKNTRKSRIRHRICCIFEVKYQG
ncbi:unnamed protein product, partial [Nesidiocoris tenuis]